jgi:hypothetical protein
VLSFHSAQLTLHALQVKILVHAVYFAILDMKDEAAEEVILLPGGFELDRRKVSRVGQRDQSPVRIDVGYTWASSSYKRVFAATAKVTNGDNADGTEITGPSNRNSKDLWLDLDYWYAPESGIRFFDYYGKKDQANTDPLSNQFTFHPSIRRQGFFGNYMYDNTLDFTAGYLHSHDNWEFAAGGPSGIFFGNDFHVRGLRIFRRSLGSPEY